MLFPTSIVGCFPQPEWLIDRQELAGRFPPRVRAQEDAGLDVVTDGEIRRSIKEAARQPGVDEATWAAWERGTTVPKGRFPRFIEATL
jgi:hypothetical protein